MASNIFAKRKENFQGDNPVKLSQETRKCYQMLIEEGKSASTAGRPSYGGDAT